MGVKADTIPVKKVKKGFQRLVAVDTPAKSKVLYCPVMAVSIAAGVGLNNSTLFNGLPSAFKMFFANGIVVASVLAIILNAILNRNKK